MTKEHKHPFLQGVTLSLRTKEPPHRQPEFDVKQESSHVPSEGLSGIWVPSAAIMDNSDAMNPLNQLKSSLTEMRLNQIDRVRALGVGDHVNLPQIVVCGDQSAGKSSVLEGLTGFQFPRQEGVCTRFATEVVMRHENCPMSIRVSIIPSATATEEEKTKFNQFHHHFNTFEDIPRVIMEASSLFGISTNNKGPAFSANTLRIEVKGPSSLHLTMVDLPGLIAWGNSDEDVKLIRALNEFYMKNPRTIILAVTPSGNDMETQSIIGNARQFDSQGHRTIGVMTKPDLVNDETKYRLAQLTNGIGNSLKLGIFLVKNPSPGEVTAGISWEMRTANEEAFFGMTDPWPLLPLNRARVGIPKLRLYLQELLEKHIDRELPTVRLEVEKLLDQSREELSNLGPGRDGTNKKRQYLLDIYLKLQHNTEAVLDGAYSGRFAEAFESSGQAGVRRLRADVQNLHNNFATTMREHGQKRTIRLDIQTSSQTKPPGPQNQLVVTRKQFDEWVKGVYYKTRGLELSGETNSHLIAALFQEQSSPWKAITVKHVSEVLAMVTDTAHALLNLVIKDDNVKRSVLTLTKFRLEDSRRNAMNELEKLLQDEKEAPQTQNHYFTDTIGKLRDDEAQKKIVAVFEKHARTDVPDHYENSYFGNDGIERSKKFPRITLEGSIHEMAHKFRTDMSVDMEEKAYREAAMSMQAYYKVAKKTWVDNVIRQVVERHIMRGMRSVFSASRVGDMTDAEVDRVAAESARVVNRRADLEKLVASLEEALVELSC